MKKKNNQKKQKKHALSHRNLANLTECYFKTNFVLLTKTFLYLCRHEKPWSMRIVANLHGREKFIGALRDKPRRRCDMRTAQDLYNFSSGWPPWIANICCLSSLFMRKVTDIAFTSDFCNNYSHTTSRVPHVPASHAWCPQVPRLASPCPDVPVPLSPSQFYTQP